MSTQSVPPQRPEVKTGDAVFDSYNESMSDETLLLGHMVLYSVFDGHVTRDDLARWFRELDLDEDLVPRPCATSMPSSGSPAPTVSASRTPGRPCRDWPGQP